MFKVSTEEMVEFFENRYEAVIVLAKEARRSNLYAGEEMSERGEKPILQAIKKLVSDGINFTYAVQEAQEEKEKKVKKEEEKKKE